VIASIPRARDARVHAAQPLVSFHAETLDEGVKVVIIDAHDELHVAFDKNLTAEELAEALTEATRHNITESHWLRLGNALLCI